MLIFLLFIFERRLDDLKNKLESESKIDKASQLIIYNNLLLDSLVTDQLTIDMFPIIDKEHPLILFSLNNTLSCDNLAIIKPSIHAYIKRLLQSLKSVMYTMFFVLFTVPALRGPLVPRTTSEIIWSAKETCGSIFYIKREIYLVTMVIELLKLSAIAFK